MTIRYVGAGGNNTNDGLSWANRKLTLNGVEDTPVASGDVVYVGPGTYREMLTCDVSGASAITYIGDVTGEHTDGVGGVVRITGSDNETAAARANCITASSKNYRTFQGFTFDGTSNAAVTASTSQNWTVQDCTFVGGSNYAAADINIADNAPSGWTIRRCVFLGNYGVQFSHGSLTGSAVSCVVENCLFWGCARGVYCLRVDSVMVKNCVFLGNSSPAVFASQFATSTTMTVNNCLLLYCSPALNASTAGFITSDYNNRWGNASVDNNVTAGTHDTAYPPGFALPLLLAGYKFPAPVLGELAPWSALRAIAGTGESTDDLYGLTRPTTSAKKSWGAVQFSDVSRSTTQTYNTSAASLKLADAGVVQFRVPVTAVSTTIACRVYREADYAGTLPRMVIKQPGQSDTTITDTGAAGAFNEMTATLMPASSPGYVIVELQSLNTATTGSYAVYFDSLAVS